MKVLFTKDYGKEKFDKIRELGYEIMYYNENIRITDWFYIHFVENPGMAFGMQVIPKAVQTIGRILFVFP